MCKTKFRKTYISPHEGDGLDKKVNATRGDSDSDEESTVSSLVVVSSDD